MTLPEIILRDVPGGPPYVSCPEVTIDGFRVPQLLRVVVDTAFDGIAVVTITLYGKVTHQ